MKCQLKLTMLLALGVIPFLLSAQKPDYSQASTIFKSHITAQVNAGLTQYYGDLNKDDLFNQNVKSAFGGCLGYQFSRLFGIRAQYVQGELYSVHVAKGLKLNTDFWDASVQYTLNINEIFQKYNEKRFLNLYMFAGAGMTAFTSTTRDFASNTLVRKSESEQDELFVPVGIGAQFRLSRHLNLNIEYGDHITFGDETMDFEKGGKPNDHYSYASAGLGLRFGGPRDSDKDGIIDKKDLCKKAFGKVELGGCPDADNDGVPDMQDECPDAPGKIEFKGCPDKDGDEIPDKVDKCPDVAGSKDFQGCPDKDNDGVIDQEDRCPDAAGKKELKGCPDKDGDGIADIDDRCPEYSGLAKFNGCPDRDNDGVADDQDMCPDVVGTVGNKGCPEESNVLVNEMVHFNTDEWIVIAKYNQLLNKIAETMRDNPGIRVSVDGHTDSRESPGYNMKLSENRADYVMQFFIDKGIDPSRLEKHFYGESRPAASNMTWEGMCINRRVEIRSIK